MRVVNPVTPGLGGPQVNKAAGWLARTGTRLMWSQDRGKRRATSIFPQPFGWGSEAEGNDPFIRGGPESDRLICEGFDPGSE